MGLKSFVLSKSFLSSKKFAYPWVNWQRFPGASAFQGNRLLRFLIRPEDTLPFIDIFQVTTVKPQKFKFSQLKINAEMPLCMICQILSHSLDAFSKIIRFNLTAPVCVLAVNFLFFLFQHYNSPSVHSCQINFLNFQRIFLLTSSPYSESIVKTSGNQQ